MPIIRIGIGTHIIQRVRISLAETLVNAFIERVEAEGGSVENTACLTTDLEFLTQNP